MPVNFDTLLLAPAQAVFGEAVTYTPAGGSALGLTGIFLAAFQEISFDRDGAQLTTVNPVLDVRLSVFGDVTPAQDDQVVVRGNTYNVSDVRPDGIGGARLVLKLASN